MIKNNWKFSSDEKSLNKVGLCESRSISTSTAQIKSEKLELNGNSQLSKSQSFLPRFVKSNLASRSSKQLSTESFSPHHKPAKQQFEVINPDNVQSTSTDGQDDSIYARVNISLINKKNFQV